MKEQERLISADKLIARLQFAIDNLEENTTFDPVDSSCAEIRILAYKSIIQLIEHGEFDVTPSPLPTAQESTYVSKLERALNELVEALDRGDIGQTRLSAGTDHAILLARKVIKNE